MIENFSDGLNRAKLLLYLSDMKRDDAPIHLNFPAVTKLLEGNLSFQN
jgi:hypothetical protein